MIVIQKKRLQIIVTCLFIGVFAFYFQIAGTQKQLAEDNIEKTQNTVQTTATPVSGKTIVVDAGHGVPDEGAESSTRNYRG